MTADSTVANVFFPPDKLAAPASKQQQEVEKVQTWFFLSILNPHAFHTEGQEKKITAVNARTGILPFSKILRRDY